MKNPEIQDKLIFYILSKLKRFGHGRSPHRSQWMFLGMIWMIRDIKKYSEISLYQERHLILKAQRGSKRSKDELLLRHVKFLIFRIHRIVSSDFLRRFGDDLLAEGILILHAKIHDYDLAYYNKNDEPRPVRFRSYIWKRIDGFTIDYLKKECAYCPFEDS
jgi:DNA-directed RNA polymerase specialized sigma subunit